MHRLSSPRCTRRRYLCHRLVRMGAIAALLFGGVTPGPSRAASPHFGHRLGIGTGSDLGGSTIEGIRSMTLAYSPAGFHLGGEIVMLDAIEFPIDARPYFHIHSTVMADFGVGSEIGIDLNPLIDPHATLLGEPGPHDLLSISFFAPEPLTIGAGQMTFYFHSTPTVAWIESGGTPVAISRQGDAVPEGGGATFDAFGEVAIGATHVVFAGSGTLGLSGVYSYRLSDGQISRLADSSQARPRASGNYTAPTGLDVDGQFAVWSDAKGVYRALVDGSAAPEQPAANGDEYAPGMALGAAFSQAVLWGNKILFRAPNATAQDGIFAVDPAAPAVIERIVDGQTAVPGGGGNFGPVQNATAGGDLVVFEGFNAASQYLGIFGWRAGEIVPVLLRNQPLGLHTVFTASVAKRAVLSDGSGVVLAASYFDGTSQAVLALDCLLISDFEESTFDEWSSHLP